MPERQRVLDCTELPIVLAHRNVQKKYQHSEEMQALHSEVEWKNPIRKRHWLMSPAFGIMPIHKSHKSAVQTFFEIALYVDCMNRVHAKINTVDLLHIPLF
jgi:hypothetical protein